MRSATLLWIEAPQDSIYIMDMGLWIPDAAKAIIGTKLDKAALESLAVACSAACNPIDDKRGTVEYRTKVAGVLGRRAAEIAFKRAGGSK